MNQSLTTTSNQSKSPLTGAFSKNGMFSIGGISLPEIALLGAAGYVLWKNKSEIESLLEKGGVQVPSIMKADVNELIATGAAFIAKSKRAFAEAEGAVTGQSVGSNSAQSGNSMNSGSSMNTSGSSMNTSGSSMNSTSANKPATPGAAQFGNKDAAAKKTSTSAHDA